KLNTRLGIGRPGKFDLAALSFGNFPKRERPIIEHVRVPYPMLFIVVSFWQWPELVATVVEPLRGRWWQILAGKFGIDEQIRMSGKTHLNQSPAVLRHNNQLHPGIRNLLRVPALVVHCLHPAGLM